jgi:glycosyltransferase involved in cell wall biosynthesis
VLVNVATRSESPRPRLSVVVITRDEESQIGRALESVRWADEIVVVDSGSTDRTEEVALRFTDRFEYREWGGFGRQKQHALDLATGEWVLSIDADEEVTPALRRAIEAAIAAPDGAAGFRLQRHTSFFGAWFGARGWRREWRLRLFLRDRARFSDSEIHERVLLDGRVRRLDGALLHYHFRDLAHQVAKLNQYSTAGARQRFDRGRRGGALQPVLRGASYFVKQYVLHGGFLYGRAGFLDAGMGAVYGFLTYAKLWELTRAESRGTERTG